MAPDLPPPTLLGTALGLHICDAIMCRLFAHNNGYPKNLWTVLGLIGGLWAVAVLILLPRRDGARAAAGRSPDRSPSRRRTDAIAPAVVAQRHEPAAHAAPARNRRRLPVQASVGPVRVAHDLDVAPADAFAQPLPSAFIAASLAAKRAA